MVVREKEADTSELVHRRSYHEANAICQAGATELNHCVGLTTSDTAVIPTVGVESSFLAFGVENLLQRASWWSQTALQLALILSKSCNTN